MFAKLKNGWALCLVDYKDIKEGARVPPVNELWAQVEECVEVNSWAEYDEDAAIAEKETERLALDARTRRDAMLSDLLWRVERYKLQLEAGITTTESAVVYQQLLVNIQALRDVPEQEGFPQNIVWPVLE